MNNNIIRDESEILRIRGVTDNVIESLGTVKADLFMNDFTISHPFHIVPDDFNIPADGIVGNDFIELYECILNYRDKTFSFELDNKIISTPILDSPSADTLVLPAKAEVYRTFHLNKFTEPQFINNFEIQPGIFVANSIASSEYPILRVLNTTNDIKVIPKIISHSENLSNFHIYSMNVNSANQSRYEILSKKFMENTPEHCHDKLLPLLNEFNDIFALPTDKMTQNNFYKQKLRLNDNTPVFSKNYRLPKSQKDEIKKHIQKLRDDDLIEPSKSPYNSPLILVPKKSTDGTKKWRMVIDYRQLNRKLIADKFPLPRIDEILDGLGRAKYFSCIDLFSGFHQIKLEENSREYTAFSTENGTFQWKVLPFGLNVAPNSFCRMMHLAFAGLPPEQAFLYMDDVIVIGTSENNHLNNLRNVFQICRSRNLKLNPDKCEFFRTEVIFLGHKCTQNGLLPDDTKTEVIRKYPRPNDKESTKRFIAFSNYYRRFIKNFAELAAPLNYLTRKRTEFTWTPDCENSFQKLKFQLMNPPILQYPDFNKKFIVTVDASNSACGAVLSQITNDQDLPICFISRSFQKGELNKPIIEKELLAIHFAITYLRPYLYGTKFLVRSDHRPLIYLYNMKNPASKLTRIRLDLGEFDFDIEHIKGTDNVAADALSRISISDLKKIYENDVTLLPVVTRSMHRKSYENSIKNDAPVTNEHINLNCYQDNDTSLKKIPRVYTDENFNIHVIFKRKFLFCIDSMEMITNEKLDLGKALSRLEILAGNLNIEKMKWPMNDRIFAKINIQTLKNACNSVLKKLKIILTLTPKIISNDVEKLELIKKYHDDPLTGGHFGRTKVHAKLKELYTWKGMSKDIATYVKNCNKCMLNKVKSSTIEPMAITPTPQKAFDLIIVDTIGPLKQSNNGNVYAVTMICDLTKFLITVPVPNKTAKTIAKAIVEHFILIYGPMKQFRSDMGTEYKNELSSEICKLLNIQHKISTAYHHQSVGSIERNHRVFNDYIKSFVTDMAEWDEYMKFFTFLYNTSKNSCFNERFSPYELVFGSPVNLFEHMGTDIDPFYNTEDYSKELKFKLQYTNAKAKKLLDQLKLKNKKYYDKKINPIVLSKGDLVLLKKEPYNKHSNTYEGPFLVENIDEFNVKILDPVSNKFQTVHKNRLIKK